MALPSFICIGAQKAGTTWLHEMISQHPDVWPGPLKEYHYFSDRPFKDRMAARRKKMNTAVQLAGKVDEPGQKGYLRWLRGLRHVDQYAPDDWYAALFSHKRGEGKKTCDFTPAYSTVSPETIRHIRAVLGDVPILYLLRDPLSRELSQLRMVFSRAKPRKNAPSDEVRWRRMAKGLQERGDYATYIPRWREVFPRENFLFVPYGRISREPDRVLAEIEAHVGLAPHSYQGLGERVHVTKSYEVPQDVVDMLAERVAPQYDFLRAEFGEDFVAQLK